MSLWRFALLLGLVLVLLVAGLTALKGTQYWSLQQIVGSRLPVAEFAAGDGAARPVPAVPGAASGASPNFSPNSSPIPSLPAPGKLPAYGNGPGIPPPAPKLYAGAGGATEQETYRQALKSLTVIGCGGGRVAIQMAGDERPQTLESGALLHFRGGLELSVRIADPSRCRVILLDHGRAVGEAAAL